MPNYSYDIEKYESILKSEVMKLSIIAIVLLVLFSVIIVYSILQIKDDQTKKLSYIQLIAVIVLLVFLGISLGSQILSYKKDITEKSYMQYDGPANIRIEHQVILGGIPTGYNEYIISFNHDGNQVELFMRKDCGLSGDIDKVYIVYSKYSNYVFEIVE